MHTHTNTYIYIYIHIYIYIYIHIYIHIYVLYTGRHGHRDALQQGVLGWRTETPPSSRVRPAELHTVSYAITPVSNTDTPSYAQIYRFIYIQEERSAKRHRYDTIIEGAHAARSHLPFTPIHNLPFTPPVHTGCVFVWGFGVFFLACVCVGGVVLCRCVCVCICPVDLCTPPNRFSHSHTPNTPVVFEGRATGAAPRVPFTLPIHTCCFGLTSNKFRCCVHSHLLCCSAAAPSGKPLTLVCLSNREILDVSRGRPFHCKRANNRCFSDRVGLFCIHTSPFVVPQRRPRQATRAPRCSTACSERTRPRAR